MLRRMLHLNKGQGGSYIWPSQLSCRHRQRACYNVASYHSKHPKTSVLGNGVKGDGEVSNRKLLRMMHVPDSYRARAVEFLSAHGHLWQSGRRRDIPPLSPREPANELDKVVHKVFGRKLHFVASATIVSSLPPLDGPEVAFAGRSNVGKSTIINTLTSSAPARTKNKPGLTRSINFYAGYGNLKGVDLPGYGFAYATEESKEKWAALLQHYISERETLKRIYLLIDARHGAKANDEDFMDFLDSGRVKYQIVLTKCDLVKDITLARNLYLTEQAASRRRMALGTALCVSAKARPSLRPLMRDIVRVAGFLQHNQGA